MSIIGEGLDEFLAAEPQPWMAHGACQHDPELFFLEGDQRSAIKVCKTLCSVRAQCAAYVIRYDATNPGWSDGVWGGMGTKEKREKVTAYMARRGLTKPRHRYSKSTGAGEGDEAA